MPHVIIKLQSGKSEEQKARIADDITKALMTSAKCAEAAVPVAIEDVDAKDWIETVYKPDIIGRAGTIYKKPGYDPL